tara:strand:+ start:742 stop:2601 length:1860 start_codon:yes stop_codon:yes gene_type:complete
MSSSSKRARTDEIHNVDDIYNKIANLRQNLLRCKDIPFYEDIIHVFNGIINVVPMIIFFGSQSTGKTTAINTLFGFHEKHRFRMATGTGMITKCPIELRSRTNINEDEERIYIKYPDNREEDCDSFQEIQKKLVETKTLQSITIIIETKRTHNYTIVDLPGCTADGSIADFRKPYMEYIKKTYLMVPSAIKYIYVRANDDLSNTHSLQLLHDVKECTYVCTHIDKEDTCARINAYRQRCDKLALVSSVNEEKHIQKLFKIDDSVSNGFLALKDDESIIPGFSALKDDMSIRMNKKTQEMLPEIEGKIKALRELLDSELERIGGRETPNSYDIIYKFRDKIVRELETNFNKEHTDFAIKKNELNNEFSVDILNQLGATCIPNKNVLEINLKAGSRRIPGSTGWWHIILPYVKEMHDAITELTKNTINTSILLDKELVCEVIDMHSNEYTSDIKVEFIKHIKQFSDDSIKSLQKSIYDYYEKNAIEPYNDAGYDSLFNIPKDILIHILNKGRRSTCDNMETIADGLLHNDDFNKMLKQSGTQRNACAAHEWLQCYWRRQVCQYHTHIFSELKTQERNTQDFISKYVRKLDSDDVNSAPEIEKKRKGYISLHAQCSDILKKI